MCIMRPCLLVSAGDLNECVCVRVSKSLERIMDHCTLGKKKSEAIICYAGLALKQGISRVSFSFRPIFKKKRASYMGLHMAA